MNVYWYYVLASLYVLLNVCALAANLFTLPGNWFIVALTLLFALLVKHPTGTGIHGWCIAAVAVLAILGEVIELAAPSSGALEPMLTKLQRQLREQHLQAVPVGRLLSDAGMQA